MYNFTVIKPISQFYVMILITVDKEKSKNDTDDLLNSNV